jgi:phytol kinase
MLDWSLSSLGIQITIVAVWLGVVGIAAESIHRFTSAEPELVRKVVHIGVGNVIVLAWWLNIPQWLGVSASILFSAIALLSYRLPILPVINTVGRKSLGTFFYAISFAVLIGWFWSIGMPQYAALGILIMTWGDGMAALVGKRFGQRLYKLWGMQKSWEGSLTMAAVSYVVSLVILWNVQGAMWQTLLVPVGIAIAATVLEAFSKLGVDNLTVPLGSAAIAFWLNQWSV